jgi:serine/threonine-protein phosphatase 2A regulatory subunit B''
MSTFVTEQSFSSPSISPRKSSRRRPKLPKWARLLQAHNEHATPHPASDGVDKEMSLIYEKRRTKRNNEAPASALSIGRFYVPKGAKANGKFNGLLRSVASERLRSIKTNRMLNNDEFQKLAVLLEQHVKLPRPEDGAPVGVDPPPFQGLTYGDFRRVAFMMPEKAQHLFTPSTFLKFRRDAAGRIDAGLFYEYVQNYVELLGERCSLSVFDSKGDGYLRENDVENFFLQFLEGVPSLQLLQEEFHNFYVFTAVRKLFFFLDPNGRLKISIKDILTSAVYREINEIQQAFDLTPDDPRTARNWFSGHSAMNVYSTYLSLDRDQNGMLSKAELAQYEDGSLTSLFLDRIWEECKTYLNDSTGENEMDYKTFLDFTLAMENNKTPQALRWFFKILDVHKVGYLDVSVIRLFFREVMERMTDVDYNADDVMDEIFDMIKPARPYRITLQDLIDSGVGATVVSMLIDVNGFWAYDNRESLMAQAGEEDQSPLPATEEENAFGGITAVEPEQVPSSPTAEDTSDSFESFAEDSFTEEPLSRSL